MDYWQARISKRYTFTAIYVYHNGTQMLLCDVCRVDGLLFRDHLFLPYTGKFKRLDLKHGDTIRITGKVNRYYKRGEGQRHVPRHLAILKEDVEITNISSIRKEQTS